MGSPIALSGVDACAEWCLAWMQTSKPDGISPATTVSSTVAPSAGVAERVLEQDWSDIRLTLTGDGAAYARLIGRYQQQLSRYLWRFTRSPQAHEELVQTVFVEAYFQLRSFAGRSPLSHWLQVIATRVGYRFWKGQTQQRQRNVMSIDTAGEPMTNLSANDPLESAEAAARVHACLERLPPRDRLVITLLHLEEKSIAEIAQYTGWSQTMVKVQAYRARGKLARLLGESPV